MNSERQVTTQNQTDAQPPSPEASFSPTVKVHGEAPPANVYEVEAKPAIDTEAKTEVKSEQSPPQPPQESQSNSTLTRLLVGGLVGGTLGTLAAALANRKTSKGFNHSAQGVSRAFKTIGQGLSQAAQGVGDAARSVGEGATYAVVGSAQDAAQSITTGTQQAKSTTTDVVHTTTEKVNQTVKGAAAGIAEGAQQVKTTAAEAVQSTTEQINQAVKDIAEGTQRPTVDDSTVEESVLAGEQAVVNFPSKTANISAVVEPALEMSDELDVIEAETVNLDDWKSEAEIQNDVANSTSSTDFVTEEITISPRPSASPEVESSRLNDKPRRK